MFDEESLKLIYVLKIGYNSKGEGLYEFIFAQDETSIDIDGWLWDRVPACDNAEPPTADYVDKIVTFTTGSFDLFCLHDAVDREYMHGYYLIHALAYEIPFEGETDGFNQYEDLMSDNEDHDILVFHYGTTLKKVTEMFYERKIIFKDNKFLEVSNTEL